MHKIKTSWQLLLSEITLDVNALALCQMLMDWCKSIAKKYGKDVEKIYQNDISYYDKLNFEDFEFSEKWYSLEYVIKHYLWKSKPSDTQEIFTICRDIFHEILIFKSDRECKLLGMDNLRVYEYGNTVIFSCDSCIYTEDISGNSIHVEGITNPASSSIINDLKIRPYVER